MNTHPGIAASSFLRNLRTYTSTDRSCDLYGRFHTSVYSSWRDTIRSCRRASAGEQLELADRQAKRLAVDRDEELVRPDLETAEPDHVRVHQVVRHATKNQSQQEKARYFRVILL